MSLSELIEKLGKTIFEAPFDAMTAPTDAPELAEIRLAVLEQILKKGQRAAGKIVFPYNLVRICIRGVSDDEAAFLKSDFLKGYFEQEIRRSLERSNYRFPADLEVEFRATGDLPDAKEEWLRVETESRPSREPAPVPARRSARLTVVRGTAAAPEILLSKGGSTSAGPPKCIARRGHRGVTIWRSPKRPRSTPPSHANMRTFCIAKIPASTGSITTAGTGRERRARTVAASGSSATV
jgi:hypothetical protein